MDKAGEKVEPLQAAGFRPWTRPVVPEEHPLLAGSEPKPVTRKTLGYGLHTTGARSIDARTLDNFHKHYQFGDVCWPHIGICPQRRNFGKQEGYRAALQQFDEQPYTYTVPAPHGAKPLVVNERGHALVTVNRAGRGRVIVAAVDYWMTDKLEYRVPEIVNMERQFSITP
jgi:hypothetical protein